MWWWVLIWVLLVVIATAEMRRSSETVAALQTQADRLGEPSRPPTPDVFGDPRRLRRERDATRASLKQQRRARQAARRPSWARHLD